MKDPSQLLVIPLTFWSGIEQGFFGADFTAVSTTSICLFRKRPLEWRLTKRGATKFEICFVGAYPDNPSFAAGIYIINVGQGFAVSCPLGP
jgi:hypothetical protein